MTQGDDLVVVNIIDLPVAIWARSQEHVDGLLREFSLLLAGPQVREGHAPRQLLELVEELQRDYQGVGGAQAAQLGEAAAAGEAFIDLTYTVPPGVADASDRLGNAMDAADEYCRAGDHLLSLATPPDALAFRRWFLGQFTSQVQGAEPVPWPEWCAANGLPATGAP